MDARVLLVGGASLRWHNHGGFFLSAFVTAGCTVGVYAGKGRWPDAEAVAGPDLQAACAQWSPDLVVVLGGSHGWAGLTCPVVVYYCDGHFAYAHVDCAVNYQRAARVITRSEVGARTITKYLGVPASRVVTLPFSVWEKLLPVEDTPWATREARVFFAGASARWLYPFREDGRAVLRNAGILDDHVRDSRTLGFTPREYFMRMAQYRATLCCTSKYRVATAKHVEAAAVGTIPLTDGGCPELTRVLPSGLVTTTVSALEHDARRVLNTDMSEASRTLREHVRKNHTHAVRGRELLADLRVAGVFP